MSIGSAIVQGRAAAEARMTDMCRVGVESLGDILDPTTLEYPVVFTPVYVGPCEFRAATRFGNDVNAVGQLLDVQNAVLKLPIATSGAVTKDHIVVIDSSATDPGLVGTRMRVTGPFADSYSTARRFQVQVTT